jgi:hypothetical protein
MLSKNGVAGEKRSKALDSGAFFRGSLAKMI